MINKSLIKLPIELIINHKPIYYKEIGIGKIIKTSITKTSLIATIQINTKYKKLFKKLSKILKEM